MRLRNRLFCGHWCPFGCLQTPCLGIEKRTRLILESWTPKRTNIVRIFCIGYLHYSPTTKIHKKPCSQGNRVICVGRKLKSKLIFKVEWEIGTFDSCNGLAQGPKGKSQETLLLTCFNRQIPVCPAIYVFNQPFDDWKIAPLKVSLPSPAS